MKRAAISGTNWTGKSATIEAFTSNNPNCKINTFELSELVKQCPYPMLEDQTIDASKWIVDALLNALDKPLDADLQLFGRSPIDVMAFTLYAIDREPKNKSQEPLLDALELLERFDTIFFCEPNVTDWPKSVSPHPSPEKVSFALLMDYYMKRVIHEYSIKTVMLSWDFEVRQVVLNKILTGGAK